MNISQNSLLAGDWAAVKSGWGFESDLGTVIFMIIVFGIILFFLLWSFRDWLKDKKSYAPLAVSVILFSVIISLVIDTIYDYVTKTGDWYHEVYFDSDSTVIYRDKVYRIVFPESKNKSRELYMKK